MTLFLLVMDHVRQRLLTDRSPYTPSPFDSSLSLRFLILFVSLAQCSVRFRVVIVTFELLSWCGGDCLAVIALMISDVYNFVFIYT